MSTQVNRAMKTRYIWVCMFFLLWMGISYFPTQAQEDKPEEGTWGIAWSPDGTRLATANPGGQIYIRDETGGLQQTLAGHEGRALAVTWSPDGNLLASGGLDPFIRVWNVETGQLTRQIEAFSEGVYTLAWQPTGGQLLAAGFDKFRAWDTSSWEPITEIVSVSILDLSWSPDGSRFAYASTPDNVGVATIEDGEVDATSFDGHTLFPYSVAWSLDGDRIISAGGRDGSVRLWDAETGEQLSILLQTDQTITDAAFTNSEGTQVTAITEEGSVYVLNASTGTIEQTLTKDAHLWAIAWNPANDLLAMSGLVEATQETGDVTSAAAIQATGFLEIIPVTNAE